MYIQICVPSYKGLVNTKLKALCKRLVKGALFPDVSFCYSVYASAYPELSRNEAVISSDEVYPKLREVDAFLFFDADMEPTIKQIEELITKFRRFNLPVLAALYRKNSAQKEYCVQIHKGPSLTVKTEGIHKVYTVGFGTAIVAREVLSKMPKPWFDTRIEYYGENAGRWRYVPEDERFCIKARALGYDVYCDFDIEVTHDVTAVHILNKRMAL